MYEVVCFFLVNLRSQREEILQYFSTIPVGVTYSDMNRSVCSITENGSKKRFEGLTEIYSTAVSSCSHFTDPTSKG